tara:strand:+ start:588 stop:719 length:132 start_codon:yes stop_codon:yes gene_type:complete
MRRDVSQIGMPGYDRRHGFDENADIQTPHVAAPQHVQAIQTKK